MKIYSKKTPFLKKYACNNKKDIVQFQGCADSVAVFCMRRGSGFPSERLPEAIRVILTLT